MPLILKPPAPLHKTPDTAAVFLAGSIEMGLAAPWQAEVETALAAAAAPVTLWNPRRDDWDATWRQTLDDPRFSEQVEWELEAQERADIIAMYFAKETKSPITLLELGLFARSGKLIVCCPDGFWRKGNVDLVCHRYGAVLVDDLTALVRAVSARSARSC